MDYYGSMKVNKLQLHAITYMTLIGSKVYDPWISLAVLLLRLCASTAGGPGSIPGQETKIPHATQQGQEKKNPVIIITMATDINIISFVSPTKSGRETLSLSHLIDKERN